MFLKIYGPSKSSDRFLRMAMSALCLVASSLIGCGRSDVDQALESDARGYFCPDCQTRFYTEHNVFADVCPQCKKADILEVIGLVCAADNYMTVVPRGRGTAVCEKCGKKPPGMALPREKDLRTWGATKRTKSEVSTAPK